MCPCRAPQEKLTKFNTYFAVSPCMGTHQPLEVSALHRLISNILRLVCSNYQNGSIKTRITGLNFEKLSYENFYLIVRLPSSLIPGPIPAITNFLSFEADCALFLTLCMISLKSLYNSSDLNVLWRTIARTRICMHSHTHKDSSSIC